MAASSMRGGRGGGAPKLSSGSASSWRTGGGGSAQQPGQQQQHQQQAQRPQSGNGGPQQPGSRWASGPPRSAAASATASPNLNAANVAASHPPKQPKAAVNNAAFPTLGAKPADAAALKMRERLTFVLISLVGTPVVATTHGGFKFIGILSATSPDADELGVALAAVQEVLPNGAGLGPMRDMLVINGADLDEVHACEVKLGDVQHDAREKQRDGFRTDTEISKSAFDALEGGRTLQKWSDDPELDALEDAPRRVGALDDAGSGGVAGGAWDQFKTNEARFGLKSDYQDEMYTTKLDRSGNDFKAREREADRLAREIEGSATNNAHIAEERNLAVDAASAPTEEDRYGAVVRNANAYIPPALRRSQAAGAATPKANGAAKNTPALPAIAELARAKTAAGGEQAAPDKPLMPSVKTQAPTPTLPNAPDMGGAHALKKPSDADPLVGDFRDFVVKERERLEKKKAALAKAEKDSRLAEFKSWAGSFKLKTPMPADVAAAAAAKAAAAAAAANSDKPRDPSLQKSLSPNTLNSGANAARASGSTSVAPSPKVGPRFAGEGGKISMASMQIPKIPPFNPAKARKAAAEGGAGQGAIASASSPAMQTSASHAGSIAQAAGSAAPSTKLSAKASSFKPFNPNAAAFTPGAPKKDSPVVAAAVPASAAATPAAPAVPANPFFGTRVIKRPQMPIHVREDFNAFKVSKVPEATAVGPMWSFTGKPYRQLFNAVMPGAPVSIGAPLGHVMGFDDGSAAAHAGVPHPQQMGPPVHPGTPYMQSKPQAGNNNGGNGGGGGNGVPPHTGPPAGQPFGMVYAQPPAFAPYRMHGQPPQQQAHMMQQLPPGMAPPQGAPPGMPYGAIPPHFAAAMQGMPFSPPMPPHAAPPGMYSPQMGNMPPPPPGAHAQFIANAPSNGAPPHSAGPTGSAQQQGGKGQRGAQQQQQQQQQQGQVPPHIQQGNVPPMFYQQPMPGMAYGSPFPPGARPPFPPNSAPLMTDPSAAAAAAQGQLQQQQQQQQQS